MRTLGIAVFVAAALFAAFGLARMWGSGTDFEQTLAEIERQMPDVRTPGVSGDGRGMSSVSLGERDYVGIISIDSLERRLPVASGTAGSADPTSDAPTLKFGSVYAGNMVLEGANSRDIFGQIVDVPDGEHIVFTDIFGAEFTFEVLTVETIAADNDSAMRERSEEWDLTLAVPSFSGKEMRLVRAVEITTGNI